MKAIVLAVGLSLVINTLVFAYDDGDFQVWNTDTEEFKISKNLKVGLEEEFRFGDNANEFYYHHYDAGLFYELNKSFSFGSGFRYVIQKSRGIWRIEDEPYLSATYFSQILGLKFDTRSRLEYRHFDYQADAWRYRNKFTVKLPWKFTRLQIQPYVSDEVFISFGDINQFGQNRAYAGLGMNLNNNLKAEIYYLRDTVKGQDTWVNSNVFGTKLKMAF